ncbi:MAG: RNA polymerase sigma-70 factor [Tannerellaceae bacterium]|nr:RNA polymerase sigma-70 factor [Tannerellaceae bacterium]
MQKTGHKELTHLIDRNVKRFIYFAYTYIGDRAVAEDIVWESIMIYWKNRHTLSGDSNIYAYILTIIKNKSLNYLHRQTLREEAESYIQARDLWELNLHIATLEAINPEKIFSEEIQQIVDKTIETLPEQTKLIFMKSRYDNLTHKEIAAQMGISTKAVEFHITKALKVLRVALKDYIPSFLLFFF